MRSIALAAALTLLLAAAAEAQTGGKAQPAAKPDPTERLILTPPAGWQAGGTSSSQTNLTNHLFPAGQTAENWTEMLSIQILADPRADPRDHIQRIVEASRTNCDAAGPSPVTEGLANGYPVATVTVTCTKGRQSGMGGLVAVKAIRGGAALYVIERVWRGPPFERNEVVPVPTNTLHEWSAFLRAVSVCDAADPARHPCPK